MYRIIGADGKEYGPVSTDQLRHWLKEGRVNSQTKIKPEGTAEWQTLGAVSEFANLMGGSVPPPIATAEASPSGGGVNGTSSERSSLRSPQFSCYLPFSGHEQTKLQVGLTPFPRVRAESIAHVRRFFRPRHLSCGPRRQAARSRAKTPGSAGSTRPDPTVSRRACDETCASGERCLRTRLDGPRS